MKLKLGSNFTHSLSYLTSVRYAMSHTKIDG